MATQPFDFLTPEELAALLDQPQGFSPQPQGLLGQADPTYQDTPVDLPPAEPLDRLPDQPIQTDVPDEQAKSPLIIHPTEPLSKADKKPPLVIDFSDKPIEKTTAAQMAEADSQQNQLDQMAADRDQQAMARAKSVVVDPRDAAFLQQFSEAVSAAPKDATVDDLKKIAEGLANEHASHNGEYSAQHFMDQIHDFSIGGKRVDWQGLVDYRQKSGRTGITPAWAGKPAEDNESIVDKAIRVTRQQLTKGGAGLASGLHGGSQMVLEIAGVDASKDDAARKYYDALAEQMPGIERKDIKSVGGALLWAYEQSVQQAPNLAVSMTGVGLGDMLAGSVGAKAGAFLSSYAMETGQVESSIKDQDPNAKSNVWSFIAAAPAAALDAIFPERLGSQLVNKFGQKTADEIALKAFMMPSRELLASSLAKAGGTIAQDVAFEAIPEGLQQGIEEWGASLSSGKAPDPGLLGRMIEAGIAGGVVGGVAGAHVAAAEGVHNYASARAPIEEMANAIPQFTAQDATNAMSPSQGDVAPVPNTPNAPLVLHDVHIPVATTPPASAQTLKNKIRQQESSGNDQARNTEGSSASGRYQFTDGTWAALGGDPAKKNDPAEQERMMDKLMAQNAAALERAGYSTSAGNMYLAHFLGSGGAVNALSNPSAQVSQAVQDANKFTRGWTNAQLIAWADRKMGGKAKPTDFAEDGGTTPITRKRDNLVQDDSYWDNRGDTAVQYDESPTTVSTVAEPSPSSIHPPQDLQTTGVNAVGMPTSLDVPHPGAVATEDTGISNRSPIADRISHILATSPVANVEAIASDLENSLNSAHDRNPAEIKLREIEQQNQQGGNDFSQPLQGEEPVFDETQSQVVAFHNPETGSIRAIGDAPENFAPSQTITQDEQAALQPIPSSMPQVGVADAGQTEDLSGLMQAQPTAPMATQPEPAPQPEATQPQEVPAPQQNDPALENVLTKIDDKLFDLETDGTKRQAIAYAKRLATKGILDERDVASLAEMAKDRDMGVEDLTSEIRTSVSIWEDGQRSAGVPRPQMAGVANDQRTATGFGAEAGGLPNGRGVSGSAGAVAQFGGPHPSFDRPLPGSPGPVTVPGRGKVQFGPYAPAQQAARDYMASVGRTYRPPDHYVKVDVARAKRIAQAYEDMPHAPNDPTVQKAYRALIDETIAQYRFIEKTGLKIEFIDLTHGDPYAASPRLANLDVAENNHLWVFKTEDGYGSGEELNVADNPMLEKTGIVIDGHELLANDVFRIVHDYFGHIKDGHGFRAEGEENAWQAHSAMFSPLAQQALTSETRGQNSWVNYGPYGEQNRSASSANTVYAPQKTGLMPAWTATVGRVSGKVETNASAERYRPSDRVSQEGDTGRAEGTGERLTRPPTDAEGNVTLDHWTLEQGLTRTDPNKWGTSSKFLSDEERSRMGVAPARTYFGIASGQKGGYVNEFQSGKHPRFGTPVHHVQAKINLSQLYDMDADPDGLKAIGRALPENANGRYIYGDLNLSPSIPGIDGVSLYEQLIKDAGYAGYWTNSGLGMVAAVFEPLDVTSVQSRAKPQAETKPREPTSREIGQQRTKLREEVRAYKQSVLDKVHAIYREMGLAGMVPVEVVNRLFAPEGGEYKGVFDPDMVIRIAAFPMGNPLSDPELRTLARHEVVHWAVENRVWKPEEWRLLKKWASQQPETMEWARNHYPKPQWTEEDILEEAVAEGFARLQNGQLAAQGKMPDGIIQRILQKLKDVITNLRLAFQNAGVTAGELRQAANLLAEFESGQRVAKLKQAQRPQFGRNIRKDSLSRELLTKGISPDQHWFLSRLKSDQKFQSAWHGSPKDNIDKFSLNYIGQGEGAQAFGWGLYFAQKKAVAEWYQRKLTMDTKDPVDVIMQVNGKDLRDWVGERFGQGYGIAGYEVADRLFSFLTTNKPYNGWMDGIHASIDNDIERWVADARKEGNDTEAQELLQEQGKIANIFTQLAGQKVDQKSYGVGGKLYHVDVPEDDQLLDLDKRLSEQSPEVKAQLRKIYTDIGDRLQVGGDHVDEANFWDLQGLTFGRVLMPNVMYQMGGETKGTGNLSDALENALVAGHNSMATSIYLRENGIPGFRYLDRDSRMAIPGEPATRNFVIFDDDLITLKAKYRVVDGTPATSPLGDPSKPDPGMIQRVHDNVMGMLTAIGNLGGRERFDWDRADNILDAWRRKMTQRYQQIIKTQRRAEKILGVDRMPVDANPMDLITADERGYKLNLLTDTMIKPMVRDLHNSGLDLADLGLYLYARHAPHRNARIAKVNKEFKDPNVNPGSGMTDNEAAQIMADFAAEGKLGDLATAAQHVDNMIEFAQQERLGSGLLSSADAASGFQPGEFYVPLRGHDEAEPEFEVDMPFVGGRRGGGFSVTGKEGHRMFGRQSKADLEGIVGHTITQAQDAVDRSYRNRVAQAMATMFRAAPDPEFVKIDRVKRVPVWNSKTGKVEYQMQTRITDPAEQQRTIYFKEDGVTHKMTFNDHNMSALRFVKAAKNLGVQDMGRFLRIMSLYTRLFTKANTQWNLDFILANAAKDIQTATVNASSLDIKGLRRAIIKNIISGGALRGAWWGSRNPAGAGFGQSKIWRQVYAEFEANGGKLDYGQTGPVEDAINRAKRDMKDLKRSPISPVRAVKETAEWINRSAGAFENMTRLAAYKALRDAGIEPKRAAVAVRELTTNFQQHGEWGPKINAAYGFANATMIGGARFTSTMIKKPQVAAAIIGVGMLADILNHLWQPDKWDEYDEDEKDREIKLLLPDWMGFDIKLPAGYGINTLLTVGRKMSEVWRGKKNKDGSKETVLSAAGDVFNSAVNAFSPVPGHSWLNVAAPSAADPFVDLFYNEDNWGHRIYPTGSDRPGSEKPNSQLVRDQTGAFWRGLAEGLNRLGGGNRAIPGFPALDHSPESYKYIAAQIGGGAARTVGRIGALAEDVATGQRPALNDIPVVRRFAGRPYGAAGAADEQTSVFYDNYNTAVETLGQADKLIKIYGKDSPEFQSFKQDHAPVLKFYKNIKAAEKRVNALSAATSDVRNGRDYANGLDKKQRHAIYKVTGIPVPQRKLTDAEAQKQLDAIALKRQRLAEAFNRDWLKEVMSE